MNATRLIRCAILATMSLGCGDDDDPVETAESHTPAPAPATAADEEVAEVEETVHPIGFAQPYTPSAALRRAVRDGLRLHEAGDFDASSERFAAVLQDAPEYDAARYDLACAFARSGQTREARETIARVLAADLPTYLPKALADEDLSPLRPFIEARGRTLAERYRAAAASGDELVAFGRRDGRHWTQVGFWTGERFVPASPKITARVRPDAIDAHPLTAAAIASDRSTTLTVLSRIDQAEAGGIVPEHRVVLARAFTGERLEERGFPRGHRDAYLATFRVQPQGAWARYILEGEYDSVEFGSGTHRAEAEPSFTLAQDRWFPQETEGTEAQQRGRRVRLDDDRWLTLPRRHGWSRIHAAGEANVVLSTSAADCGFPDSYTLTVVGPDGSVLWSEHEADQQAIIEVRGGRLILQNGEGLRVFEQVEEPNATRLPAGLGLSSGFRMTNPHC